MRIDRHRRINLMTLLEIRPLVPERPGNNVILSILVEVSKGRPFGVKFVRDLDLFSGPNLVVVFRADKRASQKHPAQKGSDHPAISNKFRPPVKKDRCQVPGFRVRR
jgi:hypothetical protein